MENKMKGSRKIIGMAILILFGGLGGAGISYYFTELNEPAATYTQTDNSKLTELRKDLKVLKEELRNEGKYACCIRGDCNWCAVQMGHCPCEELVQKEGEEKSCPECAAAWNEKQGTVPGVDADAIRVTTFGIYGEDGGHHHDEAKNESPSAHAHSEKSQDNVTEAQTQKKDTHGHAH